MPSLLSSSFWVERVPRGRGWIHVGLFSLDHKFRFQSSFRDKSGWSSELNPFTPIPFVHLFELSSLRSKRFRRFFASVRGIGIFRFLAARKMERAQKIRAAKMPCGNACYAGHELFTIPHQIGALACLPPRTLLIINKWYRLRSTWPFKKYVR